MINYQKILNKNILNVFIDILREVEKNGLNQNNHLYVTFVTNNPKNSVPDWLLNKYPNEMTIVIQHEYYNLFVNETDFRIGLSFNNKKTDLKISFNSIVSFLDPSTNFGLNYSFNKLTDSTKELKKNKKNENYSNVVDFSNFKK